MPLRCVGSEVGVALVLLRGVKPGEGKFTYSCLNMRMKLQVKMATIAYEDVGFLFAGGCINDFAGQCFKA